MSKKLSKIIFLIMMVIMLIIPNNSTATSKVKLGDINGDNKIDSRDMLIVLRHISAKTSNKHDEWKLTGEKLKIADVTQDGEINARDMIAMTRYIAAENSEKIKKEHPKWGEIKEIEIEEETKQEQKQDKTKDEEIEEKEEIMQDEKNEDIKQEDTKQEVNKKEEKTEINETDNNETNKNEEEKKKAEGTKQEENKEIITGKETTIIEKKQEEVTKQEEKQEEQKEIKQEVKEEEKPNVVEATAINLSKAKATISVGEAKVIEAKISPDNTTNKKVTYSSSNTSIATVEQITGKGTYYIKTIINDKVISIEGSKDTNSAKAQIKDNKEIESQKYDLIEAGNGYYIIRARHSGKVLDVQGAKKENSTQVIQYDLTGNDNQLWKLEDAGNGYYYIKSKQSGLYLDVQGGKANEGDKIIIYAGNKKDNQKFKIEKTGDVTNYAEMGMAIVKAKKNGTVTITAKTTNEKVAKCTITISQFPYIQYIEHAKKVNNYIWSNENKNLYWHGGIFGKGGIGMSGGGDLGAYTDAIDILWYKDYTIKYVHSKISELDHDVLYHNRICFTYTKKTDDYFKVTVGKVDRTVEGVNKALKQGKVVIASSNSGLWLGGANKWNNNSHWAVIFLWDGTYYHLKAGGTGHIVDGKYTPSQLKQWLDGKRGNRVLDTAFTFERKK